MSDCQNMDKTVAAFERLLSLHNLPGEDPVAGFDRRAMAFYAETGIWPPGKSQPLEMEMCDSLTDRERMQRFNNWRDSILDDARQAIARHKGADNASAN